MSFFYTDEENKRREEIRTFAKEKIEPLREKCTIDREFPREALRLMGKEGLCAAIHDPKYGGVNKGNGHRIEEIICEEIAYVNGAIEMTRLVSATLFGMPLATFGTEEQKEKYLPKIIKGELIGAIAMTEDEVGSDLSLMKANARKEGDTWILNGTKRFITNGGRADVISVFCRTKTPEEEKNAHKAISGLLVEKGFKGFRVEKEYDLLGMEGGSVARLIFEDCEVPETQLLGQENRGFYQLMAELNTERMGMAAACVGHAQRCLDEAVTYSNERKQFHTKIRNFQRVSFRLAEAATKLRAARLLALEAATALDAKKDPRVAASMAFANATEMEQFVTNASLYTHAGEVITNPGGAVASHWRMAPVMWVVGGTTDIQNFIISRELYRDIDAKEKAKRAKK
ncbi:MAG: acyl-CoA dehydrogenase family protein [Candidatus Helarchaeota archaeon]